MPLSSDDWEYPRYLDNPLSVDDFAIDGEWVEAERQERLTRDVGEGRPPTPGRTPARHRRLSKPDTGAVPR